MDIRHIVLKSLAATVAESSPMPFPESVNDDMLLDEFWLDSLAFANLLTRIEGELNSGPLAFSDVVGYPRTVGDLIRNFEIRFGSNQ